MNNTKDGSVPPEVKPDPQPNTHARRFAPLWVQWVANLFFGLIILGLGMFLFSTLAGMKQAPPREEPEATILRVQTYLVESAKLDRFITSFGTTYPDLQVTVSAEVSGRITEKSELKVGQKVRGPEIVTASSGESSRKLGDLFFQIDPQTYQERVHQSENLLEQNRVNLDRLATEEIFNKKLLLQQRLRIETVTAEYEQSLDLFRMNAENESTVRAKKLELEQYREAMLRLENQAELIPIQKEELNSQRATHESDLKLAQLELEKATIRSPTTGTISEVLAEAGQYVRVGDPLIQITATDRVEIPIPITLENAGILESLIAQNQWPSAELVVKEADFKNKTSPSWSGIVRRIDPVADAATRTVFAYVEVDNKLQSHPLRPGTFVYARIEAGQIEPGRGVLVPRDALLNDMLFIAVPEPTATTSSHAHKVALSRRVVILETYQLFAMISEGLQAGEEVVTTNLDIVTDGSLLEVRDIRTLDGEFSRLRIPYLQRHTPPVP